MSYLLHLLPSLFPFISHTTEIYFKSFCLTKSTFSSCFHTADLATYPLTGELRCTASRPKDSTGFMQWNDVYGVWRQLQQKARWEVQSLPGALPQVAQLMRWYTLNCKTWLELFSQSELVCLDYKMADVVMLHHKWQTHRTYEQIFLSRIEIRHNTLFVFNNIIIGFLRFSRFVSAVLNHAHSIKTAFSNGMGNLTAKKIIACIYPKYQSTARPRH